MTYDAQPVDAATTAEDRDSKPWLELIEDAQRCYQTWQDKCDNIEKLYADLKKLAAGGTDREFQIFWSNLEVLRPAIYSRPPVPVVAPRFSDRKELPRRASDMLERCLISDFESDDVDSTMRHVRDDLTLCARGVLWTRYETKDDGYECVTAEHLDRNDFLHAPARKWKEVDWVARKAWLNNKQGKARFGDVWSAVEMKQRELGSEGEKKGEKKGEVWEIWHKGEQAVVWVSPGVEEVLDIQPPLHDFDGFFPCPRPAYGTVQPRTLIPVPDMVYYRDQMEEINELTARISALSESLRLRGFYAGGATDVAEAVEAAIQRNDDNAILVPISNMAALGSSAKDAIVWLPVKEVAEVITHLVALRRQLIDDVYQITGLSDIMRGSTEENETATAQRLKSQYGSIRIQDKQQELIRVARDMTRLKAEVMAEAFDPQTLLQMSQVDDLPTQQAIQEQAAQMQQAAQQAQMAAQQGDEQATQAAEQMQGQLQELENTVTLEAVIELLKSERLRPFVLEVETDSTIQPDEDAEKQRRTEFITGVGGFIQQAAPLVMQMPQSADLVGEMLRFVAGGFRVGRSMDTAIDEFVEQLKNMPPPQPEGGGEAEAKQAELQIEAQKMQMQQQAEQAEQQRKTEAHQAELQAKAQEAEMKARQSEAELEIKRREADLAAGKTSTEIAKINAEIERINAQAKAAQQAKETN